MDYKRTLSIYGKRYGKVVETNSFKFNGALLLLIMLVLSPFLTVVFPIPKECIEATFFLVSLPITYAFVSYKNMGGLADASYLEHIVENPLTREKKRTILSPRVCIIRRDNNSYVLRCELTSNIPFMTSAYGDCGPTTAHTIGRDFNMDSLEHLPECPESLELECTKVVLFSELDESLQTEFLLPCNEYTDQLCELLNIACKYIAADIVCRKTEEAFERKRFIQNNEIITREDLRPYFSRTDRSGDAEFRKSMEKIEELIGLSGAGALDDRTLYIASN